MNNFSNKLFLYERSYLFIKVLFLFLFCEANCEDCNTHTFPDLNYLKSKTLINEYKIMITKTGIFSFDPKLSTIENSYNYTGNQTIPEEDSISYVYKSDISQFSGEDGEIQYVLCIINHFLYVLDEKGKVLFYQELTTSIDLFKYYSLVAYKYFDGFYYFILGYCSTTSLDLILLYFKIKIINKSDSYIEFINRKEMHSTLFWITADNVSCHQMKSNNHGKLLTCFVGSVFSPIAMSFNPDEDFLSLFHSNDTEGNNYHIRFISASINNDKTHALVCYINKNTERKCYYYNINENTMKELLLASQNCSLSGYGLNTYFFEKPNEYIFSCVDDNSHFFMKRINSFFNVIEDNNIFNNKKFTDCEDYSSFSIVYISQYNRYFSMINAKCNGNKNIYFFMLSDNCSLQTTYVQIITSQPKIETTLPIIETTSPKLFTTQPKIEITFPSTKSDKIDSSIVSLCKEVGKIYVEGKCICDTNNEYYTISSKNSESKCYKKSNLPKNVYYNNLTKTYELCYKTCGTCIMGGDFSKNNCLDCTLNFIKEPENEISNCVEKCKFLYYYNSLNQYSCTEDEQCPNGASLIIRNKKKCINKCINDDIYQFQYNGECLSSCPANTKPTDLKICQISNVVTCSLSEFKLNLTETIVQENVKLVAKNYANEFYYTENHISRFSSQQFTMILYKNSSCIDELKLNVTKIEYDSCIQQLKIDNNISETKNLIIAVIDLLNGDNPITTFGFFNPDTGVKLDAIKSCSDKNVIMYENIANILNQSLSLTLLKDLKINIFDLNNEFYNDICFHFDSPNGKDATLQDRIRTFYPNITLCDSGCKKKGINMTSLEAECECMFQDLLNKKILQNELIGDNLLVKEALQEVMDIISNLNLEILACYKDIYNFKYIKKNIGGFIILGLIFIQTICIIYFYAKIKNQLIKFIYSLTETYIMWKRKKDELSNPIRKKNSKMFKKMNCNNKKESKNNKGIIKRLIEGKMKGEIKEKIETEKTGEYKRNYGKKLKKNSSKMLNSKERLIKICLFNNNERKSKGKLVINKNSNKNIFPLKNKFIYIDYSFINNEIDIHKYVEPTLDWLDYDEVIEEDKRSFGEYLREKVMNNQLIINILFIHEEIRPRSIKIAILVLTIDLFFLINGLFYSDSYISEIFNSNEKETFFNFVKRSIDRFIYTAIVGSIIGYTLQFSFVEEVKIKKILLKKRENLLSLRFEMSEILNEILKKIKIFVIFNYVIVIFSWYYLSCFNNVYPNTKREWIISSLFIITIQEILPIILVFFETCIRFISIKCGSEKLFKLSLLFP